MLPQCAGALVATALMVGTSMAVVPIPVRPDGKTQGPPVEQQDEKSEQQRQAAVKRALEQNDAVAFFDESTPAELAEFFGLPREGDATFQTVADGDRPVVVTVNISTNRMQVVSPEGTYHWKVATGLGGKETFTKLGRFSIVADPANIKRRSRKYDGAPMPYAMFYHEGWAIHGTYQRGSLGRRASHGCVRLAMENVKTLFALVGRYGGGTVIVTK